MFSQNLENWAGSPRPDSVGYDKLWKLISLARERKPRENLLRFRLLSIPDSTVHTHKVSPQCDWLDESSDDKLDWMTSRIQHICTVSLQCVLTCDPSVCRLDWMICWMSNHNQHTYIISLSVHCSMSKKVSVFPERDLWVSHRGFTGIECENRRLFVNI